MCIMVTRYIIYELNRLFKLQMHTNIDLNFL